MRLLMTRSSRQNEESPRQWGGDHDRDGGDRPGKAEKSNQRDGQLCSSRDAEEIAVGQRVPEGRLQEEAGQPQRRANQDAQPDAHESQHDDLAFRRPRGDASDGKSQSVQYLEGVRPALPKNTLMPVTTSRTAAMPASTAASCRRAPASGTGSTLDIVCDHLETFDDTGRRTEDVVAHHVIDVSLLHGVDRGKRRPAQRRRQLPCRMPRR